MRLFISDTAELGVPLKYEETLYNFVLFFLLLVCLDYIKKFDNFGECETIGYHVNKTLGTCYNKTTGKIAAIYDLALAKDNGIERQLPSEQYFE